MGEAKRRKAMEDMYGMSKMPESARPFVLAMQEIVELQARMDGTEKNAGSEHQLFFDGVLNGEAGVYAFGIPVGLFDFDEYAFTASINALTGFMGATRFGMAMHSSEAKTKSIPAALDAGRGSVIMMLACIDGAWFYNMINAGEKGAASSMPEIGGWHQGKIRDLAVSESSKRFMTAIAEILKKSPTLQNKVKASMTLNYLKEHYRATVSAAEKKRPAGDVSIN